MHERAGGQMAKRAFSHARMRMCVCKKQSLFNEQDVGQQGLSAAFRDLGRERRRSVLLTRADLIKLNPKAPPKKSGRRQHTHTHTHTHIGACTFLCQLSLLFPAITATMVFRSDSLKSHNQCRIPIHKSPPLCCCPSGSRFNEQNGGQNTIKRHQSHKEVRYGCR